MLVPNVVRSADDFAAGAADMFMFAFGAPKVREVDVTVGGTRILEIPELPGMEAARKISPYGYLSDVAPGPIFIGVEADRHDGEQQGRDDRGRAQPARILGGRPQQEI